MMEEPDKDFKDYLAFMRRRKKGLFTVSGILLVIAILVTFLLPPVYRSSATILVVEQEIAPSLVKSTVSDYAAQQVRVISERVLTHSNLLKIIHRYNLYASERHRKTTGEILEEMVGDIHIDLVNANIISPLTGQKTTATIAFKIAYDGKSPEVAQEVTNNLVSLFLRENIHIREHQAMATSAFFADAAHRLSAHISKIESKLASFKQKHLNELPEFMRLNVTLRSDTNAQIMDVEQAISNLQTRRFYLQGKLAQVNRHKTIISASGRPILSPEGQLKALEARYISLSGIYTPDHPVLVRMRREIAVLKKSVGGGSDRAGIEKQIRIQRAELVAAERKYGPDHPDVIRLKKSLAALEASLKASQGQGAEMPLGKPDNPAYIVLQSQMNAIDTELNSDRHKLAGLRAKRAAYAARLAKMPEIQKQYQRLSRDLDSSQLQYQELKKKQLDAQVGQQLVQDNMGQRFSVINPPRLPERPYKPNRPAFLMLGLILSLAGGVAYVMLLEGLDNSVRNVKSLAAILDKPVLSVIPYVENSSDQARKEAARRWTYVSIVAGVAVLLIAVDVFWMPLDVLWYVVMRRLGQ
ncbi:MAG: GumC family protein [Acidiferrobacteraceae bacterium]